MNFDEMFLAKATAAGIIITQEQLNSFSIYFDNLVQTNKNVNLTAIVEAEDVAVKHFIDSLSVYDDKYFSATAKVCDVGTGAGFPGLPLKIWKPNLQVMLMDSLAKRLKFLDDTIELLKLNGIETCHIRAEDAGRSKLHREMYDVLLARAVAPLNILSEYCLPLVKVGGVFAAMKAKQTEEELKQAGLAIKLLGAKIEEVKKVQLPDLDDERAVIYLRKIKATPAIYPRKAGLPEKKPL